MHPAARPGGLSFASNGEKLRAIWALSLVSRLAARLRYGTAIQKSAVDGHFRRALFVSFLHIAERRRRGTYRRSYRCAARVRALRVNFSSDLRVLCAHAQAEADQAQEQQ